MRIAVRISEFVPDRLVDLGDVELEFRRWSHVYETRYPWRERLFSAMDAWGSATDPFIFPDPATFH